VLDYAVRSTQYAVRSTQYAVRSTQYAVRSTQYAVRSRKTVLNYLDSDMILKSNDVGVYLYSQEISKSKADALATKKNFLESAYFVLRTYFVVLRSAPQKSDTIWVYKKSENNLVLLYDKPFSSINQINKVLNISNHTIKKDLVLHNFCEAKLQNFCEAKLQQIIFLKIIIFIV
jgi:hypothetical protein